MVVSVWVFFLCVEIVVGSISADGTSGRRDTNWNVLSGNCTLSGDCIARLSSPKPCLIAIEPGWSGQAGVHYPADYNVTDRLFVDGVVLSPTDSERWQPSEYILWDAEGPSDLQLCRSERTEDPELWSGSTCPWCNTADPLVEPDHEFCVPCGCGDGEEEVYDEENSFHCSACAAGRFKDPRGSSACSSCPLGRYARDAGASACEMCDMGWFAKESTGCDACESTPDQRFERDFVKISMLGAGAFGEVWQCRHRVDGKEYAVKIIETNATEDMNLEDVFWEARISSDAAGEHPNIVRYYNSWVQYRCPPKPSESGGSLWMINLYMQMELCDGGSLHDWLRRREFAIAKGASAERQKSWARDIGDIMRQSLIALGHLHTHSLLHRDIKPRNIFFRKSGSLRLGDLGLATWASDNITVQNPDEEDSLKSGEGFHTRKAGTAIYMPPEQRHGRVYSFSADIYALGKTFVELVCPFENRQQKLDMFKHLHHHKFGLPHEVTSDLPLTARMILDMTKKDATKRPTAAELLTRMPLIQEELLRRFEVVV